MRNIQRANTVKQNIYTTCNDGVRGRMSLDYKKLQLENIQGIKIDKKNHLVEVDLEQLNCPLEEIISTEEGPIVSPDEILGSHRTNIVQVPVKERHETDPPLPDSDLLKVLHYYASKRLENQKWGLKGNLDGSALLAFGMLVEKWARDLVDKDSARMFIERYVDDEKPDNEVDFDTLIKDNNNDPEAGSSDHDVSMDDSGNEIESSVEDLDSDGASSE